MMPSLSLLILSVLIASFASSFYCLRKFSYSSKYLPRHEDKRAKLCSLQAGTGFGFGSTRSSKASDQNKTTIEDVSSAVVALKQQVLVIKDSDSCICCSGLQYQDCCKPIHQEVLSDRSIPKTLLSTAEPINIVRARYGAYALGLGDFIVQTSHHSQKVEEKNSKIEVNKK